MVVTPRRYRHTIVSSSACLSRRSRSRRSPGPSRGAKTWATTARCARFALGRRSRSGTASKARSSGWAIRSCVRRSPPAHTRTSPVRSSGLPASSSTSPARGPAAERKRSNWWSASSGLGLFQSASRSIEQRRSSAARSRPAYGTSGRPSRMSARLWRARSGSTKPVAPSAMTLGNRRRLPGDPTRSAKKARNARCTVVVIRRWRARNARAAIEELERLDEELDLADPATAELDVRRRVALRPERPVDLRLHRADRRDDPRVDARPVHDVARLGHEARPHAEVAGRDARLDERLTLPELGAVPVVGAVPREREDDGARSPLRPEAQVHAEGVALVGDPLEEGHDLAADTREVLAVLDTPAPSAGRLAVGPIGEHEVDVRRVIQLLATELSHRDDGHAGLSPGRAERRAVLDARRRLRKRERLGEAHVGEVRQLLGRHGEVGVAQEVPGADAEEVAVLETAPGT